MFVVCLTFLYESYNIMAMASFSYLLYAIILIDDWLIEN
jgi:hypothetical protein